MIRYLLGDELSAEEQDDIEESFGDNDFFERFLRVEDDLVDEYIRGNLPPRERELFKLNYLASARRREKVAVARTLMKLGVPAAQPTRQPAKPGRLAALWESARAFFHVHRLAVLRSALGVAVVALSFLIYRLISLTDRLSKVQSVLVAEEQRTLESRRREEELRRQLEQQTSVSEQYEQEIRRQQEEYEQHEEELQRELQRLKAEGSRSLIAYATVVPSPATKGSNFKPKVIEIGRGVRWLTLSLVIEQPGDFNAYRVEIAPETAGDEITRHVVSNKKSDRVKLRLPAASLVSDDYTVTVYGIRPGFDPQLIGGYEFSIRKK
jgi:hypothetical protein